MCIGKMQRSVVIFSAARNGGTCLWAAEFQLLVEKLAQCLPWYPTERGLRLAWSTMGVTKAAGRLSR